MQVAARAEQHQAQQAQQSQQQYQSSPSPSTSSHLHPGSASNAASSSSTFNFAGNQSQRRPQLAQQGIAGMGGMGGSMRPPGKSGLTFDHILSRLQGELQKSRETGAELHTLTGAMTEIHDTLGGNLVCWTFSYFKLVLVLIRSIIAAQPPTIPSNPPSSASRPRTHSITITPWCHSTTSHPTTARGRTRASRTAPHHGPRGPANTAAGDAVLTEHAR